MPSNCTGEEYSSFEGPGEGSRTLPQVIGGIAQNKRQTNVTVQSRLPRCLLAGLAAVTTETQRGARGRQRRKQDTASATSKRLHRLVVYATLQEEENV